MAVWGQGDPRWIVEARDDGKNINGWHWSEVNKLEWTKQRLAELLPGVEAPPLELPGPDGGACWTVRLAVVKSVTGEAMLTTRKGNKRFAYYDLKLTLGWEALPPAAANANSLPADGMGAADASADAPAAGEGAEAPAAAADGDDPALPAERDAPAAQEGDAPAAAEAAAEPAAAPVQPISGEITVAEFGSGSDHDDIEWTVTASGGAAAAREPARRHVQSALWPLVLQRLELYVRELSEA